MTPEDTRWQFLATEESIPSSGLEFAYTRGDSTESGILIRTASGPHAFRNVCRHLQVRLDRTDPGRFATKPRIIFEENGDVIVGVRTGVPAGARSEQNDALEPLAVGGVEGRPEPGQDGIVEGSHVERSIKNRWILAHAPLHFGTGRYATCLEFGVVFTMQARGAAPWPPSGRACQNPR